MIRLSRSSIEKYLSCKRCFVSEYRYGVLKRSLPFTLNIAVDNLCKNEFDYYRDRQEPHPMFQRCNIDAIPFSHRDLGIWRNNIKGIRYVDKEYGYDFGGAVDDVWVKPNGDLIIVDFKSTARDKFDWNKIWKADYPKAYKRQLEMYQWLFRKNGFNVANQAYLVYYNGLRNERFFHQTLKFNLHLIPLECNDDWVEDQVIAASRLLASDQFPESSETCSNCSYLIKRVKLQRHFESKSHLTSISHGYPLC